MILISRKSDEEPSRTPAWKTALLWLSGVAPLKLLWEFSVDRANENLGVEEQEGRQRGAALPPLIPNSCRVTVKLKKPLLLVNDKKISRKEMSLLFACLQAGNMTEGVKKYEDTGEKLAPNYYWHPGDPQPLTGGNTSYAVGAHIVRGKRFDVCWCELSAAQIIAYFGKPGGPILRSFNFEPDATTYAAYGDELVFSVPRGRLYAVWLGRWDRRCEAKVSHRGVTTKKGTSTIWGAIKGFFGGNLKKSKSIDFAFQFGVGGATYILGDQDQEIVFSSGMVVTHGKEHTDGSMGIDLGNALNKNIKKIFG